LFGISWSNGREVRLKSLLTRGVNVEDIGKAMYKVVSKSQFNFIRWIGIPFAFEFRFFNEFECKLALSCTAEAM